ncbi:PEP-CTERM sorting domain-containing protein [Massilia sp. CCM 9210]|uniref:PEP-CTERM sorting domain-containing protein n=1 Tax=Massilia scottii TaxID=3057166 RepID=UPI002796C020|nr:PEP-CTERM sorting domain-containing protein [Massilia sp. CCM 9210]MDQ1816529.1 PEP-CTERM sorting domain-containing protein [Massilia sp. CCM 9210]
MAQALPVRAIPYLRAVNVFTYHEIQREDHDLLDDYGTISGAYATGSASATSAPTGMHVEAHVNSLPSSLAAHAHTAQSLYFTLSPSTRLLFSAQADAFLDEDGIDRASSNARMSGQLFSTINGVSGFSEFHTGFDSNEGNGSRLLEGALSSGAAVATGTLYASTMISLAHDGATPTSPVPEPATYGMLAAGLLVIGAARRKARKA